jgi:hypothetical protein
VFFAESHVPVDVAAARPLKIPEIRRLRKGRIVIL